MFLHMHEAAGVPGMESTIMSATRASAELKRKTLKTRMILSIFSVFTPATTWRL